MKDFDQLLEEDVAGYQGPHARIISQAPAFFRLLTSLLEDPVLLGRLRPLVVVAIAYFAVPHEIMPEDLEGPHGYLDDVFLSVFIADRVRRELGSDEILVSNWEGEVPILPLIEEVLSRESELIGDKRELILWYIGYEYLIK